MLKNCYIFSGWPRFLKKIKGESKQDTIDSNLLTLNKENNKQKLNPVKTGNNLIHYIGMVGCASLSEQTTVRRLVTSLAVSSLDKVIPLCCNLCTASAAISTAP